MTSLDESTKRYLLKDISGGDTILNSVSIGAGQLGGYGKHILKDLARRDAGRHQDEALKGYLRKLKKSFSKMPGMKDLKDKSPKKFEGSFINFYEHCLKHIGEKKNRSALKEAIHRLNKVC